MKRVVLFLLVMVMCLSLCACGKSQAVKDVENAITEIGEVSLESNDVIQKAERLYNNLTEKEKADVANKAALVEARFAYDKFYNDKIFEIAKEAYDTLSEAAELYYFEAKNLFAVGEFANKNNVQITDADFCEKLAAATSPCYYIKGFTEEEIQQGLEIYLEKEGTIKNTKADSVVCMNIILSTLFHVRDDYQKPMVEKAGALLIKLNEDYHDEKYYPALSEYRDFVATGDLILLNMKKLDDLKEGGREFQAQNEQLVMKIEPLFAK